MPASPGPDPADPPPTDPFARSPYSPEGAPAPLLVAAGMTLVQGLLTVMYGVVEVVRLSSDRLVMGTTTSVFFLVYGGALVVCAWGMQRVGAWARGPVLLAQLIWLGLAWSFRGGDTLPLAIGLAVGAAVVLAGLLHPLSIDALERAADRS